MKAGQKKKSHRVERMNDLFREAIAKFLIGGLKFKGHTRPKPGSEDIGFVTVTRVKVSADLQLARVFFTTIAIGGNDDPKANANSSEKALKALRGAAREIRHHLAQELNLRRTPELEFFYDDELEEAYRLERVFYDIEQKKKLEEKQGKKELENSDENTDGDVDEDLSEDSDGNSDENSVEE